MACVPLDPLPASLRRSVANASADTQPEAVIRLLNRHGAHYVVIGGLAATAHGSPTITEDIDICYAREDENLERLSQALREIHAELRGADPGLPFRLDARSLKNGDAFTLTTDLGWIDILGTPAGTSGFGDLASNADEIHAFGETFLIASVDDLIRMKRAAGRPKDRVELGILGALREEIERQEDARER